MKSKATVLKKETAKGKHTSLKWSGLQFRMTVSYALTSIVAVLLLEILLGTLISLLLLYGPVVDSGFVREARQTAKLYALAATVQDEGAALNPHTTFEPGQPSSIALGKDYADDPAYASYIKTSSPDPQAVTFALLIDSGGHVLASSYPAQYPLTTPVADLLPGKSDLIKNALRGVSGITVDVTSHGHFVSVVEPVWNREKQTIGAVYLQVLVLSSANVLSGFIIVLLISGVLWLVLTLPVGGLFGLLTTRGLIRRLRQLVTATSRFADGDYAQRVQVSRQDEVGQLEQHFNQMAEQLVESLSLRQALAEQGARMAERARIARDLHDSVKQQVFAVSMQLGAALSLLEQKREAARQHLEEADILAYHVQQELTTLIQELRPLALQDKGLAVALQEYVKTWSQLRGIAAEMHVSVVDALPMTVEEALWRIAQEAFSNIARHSSASRVEVSLTCQQGKVILSISDNGQGFDRAVVNASGVGLHSMQERMEALGGTVTIQSKVGEGTCILAQCPCSSRQPDVREELYEESSLQ